MTSIKLSQFASELNMPLEALQEQLAQAGVKNRDAGDDISDRDKTRLLDFLRRAHGEGNKTKITLTRKETSQIKSTDAHGRAHTVQVEVRKKRVLVKRDPEAVDKVATPPTPSVEAPPPQPEVIAPVETPTLAEPPAQRKKSAAKSQPEAAEATASAPSAKPAPKDKAAKGKRATPEDAPARATGSVKSGATKPGKKPAKTDEAKAEDKPESKPAIREAAVKTGKTKVVKKHSFLDEAELKKRAEEEQRHQKLQAQQEREIREKEERQARLEKQRKEVEEKQSAADKKHKSDIEKAGKQNEGKEDARPAPLSPAGRGDKKTLRPNKDGNKKGGRDARDNGRKKGLKTRGATSGEGWKEGRHGKKGHHLVETGEGSFQAPTEPIVREVHVPETISVAELAHKMSVKAGEVIKTLMKMGTMVTINQILDQETAMIVVEEMGHAAIAAKLDDPDAFLDDSAVITDAPAEPRAPVVTVMG
ncbi:MAG: translation initiation factor IF-2 N-terminal domain-containing protein, partial [Zoogloeaceae bacterium]|nr:translation initiation factor IF-2 N-terminal domain-containing protein [Zoogloeaceae bacterium]